jgi:two-component system cell cycle response regulator
MDNKSEYFDVEIVGFKPNERILIASMFKLSRMRPQVYQEWLPDQTDSRPDCILVDLDDNDGRMRVELALIRKSRVTMITIGTRVEEKFKIGIHIERPIRWATMLHTLDLVFGEAAMTASSELLTEEFSKSINDLEVLELQPWYDRDQSPTEFATGPSVLVLDPDPVVSAQVILALANSNYRVDRADNIAHAHELMKENRYNCVVLEVDLPGESGIDFCRSVKQMPDKRRSTAVILLTENRKIEVRLRGSHAGCDAFLCKPVDPTDLVTTLEKFLPNWQLKAE